MSRADRVRGLTLVEAMIAAALTLLLFAMVLGALGPSMRASARSMVQADLQQQVDLALRRVEADLRVTVGGGLGLLPDDPDHPARPVALGIVRIGDVTGGALQVWDTEAVIYWWDRPGQRLLRRTWRPGDPPAGLDVPLSPDRPLQLTAEELEKITAVPSVRDQVLATGVTRFELKHAGADTAITPPITVELDLRRPVPGQEEPETWTGARTMALRLSRVGP